MRNNEPNGEIEEPIANDSNAYSPCSSLKRPDFGRAHPVDGCKRECIYDDQQVAKMDDSVG
jgi:hypothetical protein